MASLRTGNGETISRAARISAAIDDHRLAAIVVAAPDTVGYLSGFYHPDLRYVPKRLHIVVWPAHGEPVFVVPALRAFPWLGKETGSYLGVEDTRPGIAEIRPYEGEGLAAVPAVAEALTELGAGTGALGVELDSLPAGFSQELRRLKPGLVQQDVTPILNSLHGVKTGAETDAITCVNKNTAETLELVLATARPGETERALAGRVLGELWERGATELVHGILAVGPRSAGWHATPSARELSEGMLIRTDWGVRANGFASDIARNAVVGKASAAQKDRFARISEVHDTVVDALRPGVLASDLALLARRCYKKLGLEFRWGIVGHGVGRTVQEAPLLWPDVHEPILEGMTLEIELGYFGRHEVYHIEDLVRVSANSAVNLTRPSSGRALIESSW